MKIIIKKLKKCLIFYIQFNHNETGTVFSNLSQIHEIIEKKWTEIQMNGKKLFKQSC